MNNMYHQESIKVPLCSFLHLWQFWPIWLFSLGGGPVCVLLEFTNYGCWFHAFWSSPLLPGELMLNISVCITEGTEWVDCASTHEGAAITLKKYQNHIVGCCDFPITRLKFSYSLSTGQCGSCNTSQVYVSVCACQPMCTGRALKPFIGLWNHVE